MILMIVENSAIVSVSNDNNLTRDQLASAISQAVKDKKADDVKTSKKVKDAEKEQADRSMEKLQPEQVISDFVDKRVAAALKKGDSENDVDLMTEPQSLVVLLLIVAASRRRG